MKLFRFHTLLDITTSGWDTDVGQLGHLVDSD